MTQIPAAPAPPRTGDQWPRHKYRARQRRSAAARRRRQQQDTQA